MLGKHYGQDTVRPGTYINIKSGELLAISGEDETLPGTSEASYLRVPLPFLMVFGPILGLAFILFLPAAGLAVLANFSVALLRYKTVQGIAAARGTALQMAAPRHQPGVSYLHERGVDSAKPTRTVERRISDVGSTIDQLEREISERRLHGER